MPLTPAGFVRPLRCLLLSWTLVAAVTMTSSVSRAQAEGEPGAAPEAVPEQATTDPATANPADAAPAAVETSAAANDESRVTSQVASFTATRLKDSPAVVTVITGEDIRASGARDLTDILYMVPGYFFGADTEGVVGPGIRGLWGYEGKILLMIDGKEMNELLFSTVQLGNEFPVELIERVEVVRGPGSVIYGGNAELSVINVVTRSLQGSTDALVTTTYGQMTGANSFANGYGRRMVSASARYVFDQVPGLSSFASIALGQGQRSVHNYVDNSGTAATMEGQSALNPSVVQAGVGYRDLQASFLYHRLSMTTIDGLGMPLTAPAAMAFDSYHGELVGAFRPTSRFELVPRFNYTYQTPWRLTDTPDLLYDKSVRRVRGRVLGRWAALDQLQITVGGDAIFDSAQLLAPRGDINTPFGTSNSVDYQTFGAYVELFSENPIVNVAAGARYDHLSSVGGDLVPRLALQRSFGPLSLKGIYSQSFRAPGIENLNAGIIAGVNVRPERTRIFELEGILDLPSRQRISANIFDIAIDRPIAFFTDPVTMADSYVNLGRQGSRGIEISYRIRQQLVNLEANYSFYTVTAADNTPSYNVPGHPDVFMAAPSHRAYFRATIRPWEWLSVSPSATVLGPRYMRGPDTTVGTTMVETATAIPSQALANLYVYSEQLGIPGLTVGLGIYNIFGADYRFVHVATGTGAFTGDHASIPGLDREVMLRVSYLLDPSRTK
jgi:outer membrane receptor protein involved in Fe transport